MKVRKNITLSKEADNYLRTLAKLRKKSQIELIEELIKKEAKKYERDKKLKIFEELIESAKNYSGFIGNKTIQQIKEEMGNEL